MQIWSKKWGHSLHERKSSLKSHLAQQAQAGEDPDTAEANRDVTPGGLGNGEGTDTSVASGDGSAGADSEDSVACGMKPAGSRDDRAVRGSEMVSLNPSYWYATGVS